MTENQEPDDDRTSAIMVIDAEGLILDAAVGRGLDPSGLVVEDTKITSDLELVVHASGVALHQDATEDRDR